MGSGAVDSSQWLSVKEETIFLHDGLIRVTDLAELPSEIGVSEQGDTEQEVGKSHRSFFQLSFSLSHTHMQTNIKSCIQEHLCIYEISVSFCLFNVRISFDCHLKHTLRNNGSADVCKFPVLLNLPSR